MTALPDDARRPTGSVRWMRNPSRKDRQGFDVVGWRELIDHWVAPARNVGMERKSLANAADAWLKKLDSIDRLAVVDVELDGPQAVADLHDYVVAPALQRGIELIIGADRDLPDPLDRTYRQPEFGYAYALERLHWRLSDQTSSIGPIPVPSDVSIEPSPAQAEAIGAAADGVVQIIAPAGSGKTAVLIERVRALLAHGVPANSIVCMTFNYEAKEEMRRRLKDARLNVDALTFHGLGREIAIKANLLSKSPKPGPISLSQWRRICTLAKLQEGEWIDPADAKKLLSDIKLKELRTAEQYADSVADSKDPRARAMAVIYSGYREAQRKSEKIDCDFDDFLLHATQALRNNADVRATWQGRYHHVLVDEYQDIEPAQELIVRLVAAPQDQLFCVGDEDKTLYAFRRASVARIICLDGPYPGLERVQLDINYRCPSKVVTASENLINVNVVRFPKVIKPDPARQDHGKITINGVESQLETATQIATLLKGKDRGQVTVLSRTTNGLRPVALACAREGIKIDGHDKLFQVSAAFRALQHHLLLALQPTKATAYLVRSVCSVPARHVPDAKVAIVARKLRAGKSFAVAFAGIPAPARDDGAIWAPDQLFTALAVLAGVTFTDAPEPDGAKKAPTPAEVLDGVKDVLATLGVKDLHKESSPRPNADKLIALLRGPGGFDAWFGEADQLGGIDTFEEELLQYSEFEAAGAMPQAYTNSLRRHLTELNEARDEVNGIELLTVHGAKGLQWPEVIVLGCNDGMLPNSRSLRVSEEDIERGEGMEAERRIAYVAFTRAQKHLQLFYNPRKPPSDFLGDAGLLAG